MTHPSTGAVVRLGLLKRNFFERFDEGEEMLVRFLSIKLEALIAYSVAFAAFHPMAIVVEHFLERAEINDGLVPLEAGALLSLERLHGQGAELDAFNSAPGFLVPLENLNAVKARVGKRLEKTLLSQRAGNATAPQFRIILQMFRHFLVGYDVGNHRAPAFVQYAENFGKQLPLGFWLDQIQNAVGNGHIN